MNLLQAIQVIKQSGIITDYSMPPNKVFRRLATVRQIKAETVYRMFPSSFGIRYTYTPDAPTFDSNSDTQELPSLQVIAPTLPHAVATTSKPVIGTKCGIRLTPRTFWRNETKVTREQWSHPIHEIVGHRNGFVLLKTEFGVIGRRPSDVNLIANDNAMQKAS